MEWNVTVISRYNVYVYKKTTAEEIHSFLNKVDKICNSRCVHIVFVWYK